jgi:hypothetical protein
MVLLSFSISPPLLNKTKLTGALPRPTLSALLLKMVLPNGAVLLTPTVLCKPVPLVLLTLMLLLPTAATTQALPTQPFLSAGLPT